MNSAPQIVLVTWGFDPEQQGGIARFGIELAAHLSALGVEVHLWGLLGIGTQRENTERHRLESLGVCTRVFPQDGELHTVRSVIKALLQFTRTNPQCIVSVHGALAELCGAWLKRWRDVCVVRTVHSEREWYKRPRMGRWIDWASARWLDGEIGVSSRITHTINQRRAHRHSAVWIPPITTPHIVQEYDSLSQLEARKLLNLPINGWLCGSVGRFTPQKGYDMLLKATALLNADDVALHVALLGDGPLHNDLQQQMHQLGIEQQVTVIEPRAQVGHFLRALDVYVSSSLWEGLSLSVLEAAWCGLPVVATDVSGTDDIQQLLNIQFQMCNASPQSIAAAVYRAKTMATSIRPSDNGAFAGATVAQQYLDYFLTLTD